MKSGATTIVDYLVIGAGSGGIASARRAASHGAKVMVVERSVLGGTCVNVGCVPKKIMWEAATIKDIISESKSYGFNISGNVTFDYKTLKAKRQAYISRLNSIYDLNLKKDNVELLVGTATFTGEKDDDPIGWAPLVTVGDQIIKAKKILIATGSYAHIPQDVEGGLEYGLTSDGFFELDEIPKSSITIGSGYIAVELAHVLKTLGCDNVTMVIRFDSILRTFDTLIQNCVMDLYEKDGINFYKNSLVKKLEPVGPFRETALGRKVPSSIKVHIYNKHDESISVVEVEKVFFAVGRYGNTKSLNIDAIGVQTTETGLIKVDKFQNTSIPNVYSVGDSCGEPMLAPVAIAAGRKLSDRLFNDMQDSRLRYENIASVVFSGIPCASVGLSEKKAQEIYGKDKIKIYNSKFVPLYYSMIENKKTSFYKLVCLLPTEKVIGVHMFGRSSDEIMQGFAVAVVMGATKADLDNCVAIHPTSSEELVTMK